MYHFVNLTLLVHGMASPGSHHKGEETFLANAQVFKKGSDHCLVCFYKKVGSNYILGRDDYYFYLEYFS